MTTESQNDNIDTEQQEIVQHDDAETSTQDDETQNDWSEEMKSEYEEIQIVYDLLRVKIMKWNRLYPEHRRHCNIRSYYYKKKEKITKVPKPKKYSYVRKTIGVKCKNICGTEVHVNLEDYREGNEYTCAMCMRIAAKAYKRGKYLKLKSKNVDTNNEIDVEASQLLNFEPC